MCGIAGFIPAGPFGREASPLIEAMCDAMNHRGPDGGGAAVHEEATLGMRRLAIVDVVHGDQPMYSDDGSIAIVYNGEVYNAPELRRRLEGRGVRFRTRSDTEVVLRLYEQSPDHVEDDLVGMWAFAIHDRRRCRLVLSRDRFGIKPLFVADAGGALAFASDLRCFQPIRSMSPFAPSFALDASSAHAMLSWAYVPENATIYAGVKRVPPATRLEIDLASGERRSVRYWSPRPSEDAARVRSLGEACEMVEPLLKRAVKEHLESDVPIAAFLSGGIDSSLVTAYAVEASLSPMPIRAYSIGFREPRFDESPFAREVAARLGVAHEVEYLDENAMRELLADALLAYDEPFGDSSSLATFALSRVVARSHKVALGGDGGDEVFAGYKKYRIIKARDFLARAPGVRQAVARAVARVPVRRDRTRGWTEVLRTLGRVARGLDGDDAAAYVALTQVGALAQTAPLLREPTRAAEFEALARGRFEDAPGDQLGRTLAADMWSVLPNDMLTKVDRASMACSLEARVPFLDHRVVETGLGLPRRFTLAASGKAVLKALYEKRFGKALARRKKQGFGVPVEKWLRTSLGRACDELFSKRRLDRAGLLSSEALSDGAWRNWAARDPQLLWHAFALAAWCEVTHGEGPNALRGILDSGR